MCHRCHIRFITSVCERRTLQTITLLGKLVITQLDFGFIKNLNLKHLTYFLLLYQPFFSVCVIGFISELSSLSFIAYRWTSKRELFVSVVCTFLDEPNNVEVVLYKVPVIFVGSLGGSDREVPVQDSRRLSLAVAANLSPSHCSAVIITLWVRGTSASRRGVKVRSGTVQAVRLWRLFWKSAGERIAAKSLHCRGRIVCSWLINEIPIGCGPVYRVDRKRKSNFVWKLSL
jgi:hypothetical protein